MCMGGGGSPKVETPKPPPLPPPMPAPPPPVPVQQAAPKKLEAPDAKPDIRIGGAKQKSERGSRTTSSTGRAASSLTIGDSQGLKL